MLKIILDFHKLAERVVNKGAPIFKITRLSVLSEIMRMKNAVPNDKPQLLDEVYKKVQSQFSELEKGMV
jgi:vacuolar-type H+-ATPase catalytic subunit A/Vma1